MTDDETPEHSNRPTGQAVRGFTVAAVPYFLGMSLHPYADVLPQETLEYLLLAVLVVMAYGVYLVATSPLVVDGCQWVEDEVAARLDAE